MKFSREAEMFDPDNMGEYTNKVLGWNQPKLNTPTFIKKDATSVFCKMYYCLSIAEKRSLLTSEISDVDLKAYIDRIEDTKLRFLWDATYFRSIK